jgi:hypothetical protein
MTAHHTHPHTALALSRLLCYLFFLFSLCSPSTKLLSCSFVSQHLLMLPGYVLLVRAAVVVNGVGNVNKNLFSSWSVGYSYNTENFVINYDSTFDNTTAALARLRSGSAEYVLSNGQISGALLPAHTLQVPVTGSALVMAVNMPSSTGLNVSSLVRFTPGAQLRLTR